MNILHHSKNSLPAGAWSDREKKAFTFFLVISTVMPWSSWFVLKSFGWNHSWSMPLFVLGAAFCSMGGIAAILIQFGWEEGKRCILARIKPQGGPRPWLMALLWGPIWMLLAYLLYVVTQGKELNFNPAALAGYWSAGALFLMLTGPLGEEFGWRGFLLPALLRRWSLLKANLVIGLWWAVWHWPLMMDRWSGDPIHFPYFVFNVIVFSFMISAVYLLGGILPAMAVHWAINASQEVVPGAFGFGNQPDRAIWLYVSAVLIVLAYLGIKFLERKRSGNPRLLGSG